MIMLIGGWATLHHVEELSDTYVQKSLKIKKVNQKNQWIAIISLKDGI